MRRLSRAWRSTPARAFSSAASPKRVLLYDTTLRDGTQGEGISLSLHDKLSISERLDDMGFDYIEGGYPLSNEKDVAFFEQVRTLGLRHATVCAFRSCAASMSRDLRRVITSRCHIPVRGLRCRATRATYVWWRTQLGAAKGGELVARCAASSVQ